MESNEAPGRERLGGLHVPVRVSVLPVRWCALSRRCVACTQIQTTPQPARPSPYAQVRGTALEIAERGGHVAVAELLREAAGREEERGT